MAVTEQTLREVRQLRESLDRVLDRQAADLARAWADAWSEIAPDLRVTLADMLADGDRVTRAQLLRSQRLRSALAAIASQLRELSVQAGVRITGDLADVVETAAAAQASVIDSQLPPGFTSRQELAQWGRFDPRQLEAIVRRTTERITAQTRPLSSEASVAVRRELVRGVAAGSNPRETARRMVARTEGRFNGGLNRALTIARTETLDAHRNAALVGREPAADVLAGWRWSASLDRRVCPACLARHGTFHPSTEPGPLGHPNCRCAAIPETKPWAELGFTDIPEPPSLLPDSRAWFDGLPDDEQAAIMGRGRLDLLRSGQVGWDELATLRHSEGWRDSWQVTPLRRLTPSVAA